MGDQSSDMKAAQVSPDPVGGMLVNRWFGTKGKPAWTETTPSKLPEDVNSFSPYIPDFLTINTPFQFPRSYKESLAGYAGYEGDPVEGITDIFKHPEKYGIWEAPKTIQHKAKKPSGPLDKLYDMASFGITD